MISAPRKIAWTLTTFLQRQGHWHDQITVQHAATAIMHRLGDGSGEAFAHRYLGRAHLRLSHLGEAHTHVEQAFTLHKPDLARAIGERNGQARANLHVSFNRVQLGDHEQALQSCHSALQYVQEIGHLPAQVDAWDILGRAHHHLGHHTAAISCYQQALQLFQDLFTHPPANDSATQALVTTIRRNVDQLCVPSVTQRRSRRRFALRGGPAGASSWGTVNAASVRARCAGAAFAAVGPGIPTIQATGTIRAA